MSAQKDKVQLMPREKKGIQFVMRMLPSTKRHLVKISDDTGYTMASLVEYAILKLRADEFRNCSRCSMDKAVCECG